MSVEEARFELGQLAEILCVPPERVGYLESLGAEHICALREQIEQKLYSWYAHDYRRMARLVRFVPKRRFARHAGTVLPSRILGRAVDSVFGGGEGIPLTYLSDVPAPVIVDASPFMNPRTVACVVGANLESIPTTLINDVMAELMQRGDFTTIDRIMAYSLDQAELVDADTAPTRRPWYSRIRIRRRGQNTDSCDV